MPVVWLELSTWGLSAIHPMPHNKDKAKSSRPWTCSGCDFHSTHIPVKLHKHFQEHSALAFHACESA